MDPFTIATAALSIAGICIGTVKRIKDTISRVQEIPHTLSRLERSVELMVILLSELENALRTNHGTSTDATIEERLVHALDGCRRTLERLLPGLETLSRTQHWPRRVGFLWKENTVVQMVANLDEEKENLQMILGILNIYLISRLSDSIIVPEKQHYLSEIDLQRSDADEKQVKGTPNDEVSPSAAEWAPDQEMANTELHRTSLTKCTQTSILHVFSDGQAAETAKIPVRQASASSQRRVLGNIQNHGHNSGQRGLYLERRKTARHEQYGDENFVKVFEDS